MSPLHRWLRTIRTIVRGSVHFLSGKHAGARIRGLRLLTRLRIRMVVRKIGRGHHTSKESVRLWADANVFNRLEHLFEKARHTIIVQMFIWADDATGKRMAECLVDAADRGVEVHVTKEIVGDVFEASRDFVSTKNADDPLWKRFWNHARIHISHHAHVNHAKCVLIDERFLMVMGMNFADEYRFSWHDYAVELRGSSFVRHYLAGTSSRDGASVRLLVSIDGKPVMRQAVMHLLRDAKKSIVVEQAYIADPDVLDLLVQASKQEIDVVVILPDSPDIHRNANMESVRVLLQKGNPKRMRVLLFPGMVHGKVILVDHAHALIGSTNLISSSLDGVGEACVLISRKPLHPLVTLRRILLRDIVRSRFVERPPRFSLMRKLLAWVQL